MSYAVAVLFVRNDCASRCPNANETSSRPPGWHLWTEKQQQAGAGGRGSGALLPWGSLFLPSRLSTVFTSKTWICNSPPFLFKKGLLLGKVESEFEVKS